MPWQRDALDVALEFDPFTGHYHYPIVVVSVPRQSGKTTIEGDVADHRCVTTPRGRVWITMQRGKTVDRWMRDEHFADLKRARVFGVPSTPSCKYVRSKRAGEVGVKWPGNESSFLTFPPTEDSLHSAQSDLVFVDEAWSFDAVQGAMLRQAIRPTMLTRKGAQLWIVSTMGTDSSAYLDDYVAMGRASIGNPEARVCFVDYGLEDDDDPDDLELVASRHPAYGHTVDLAALADAREEFRNPETGVFDLAGWARAYGNKPTRTKVAAIPAAVWTAAGRQRLPVPARAGLGLDVDPAGLRAALVAGWRADLVVAGEVEPAHGFVDVLYSGPTTRELPAMLAAVARARRVPIVADRAAIGAIEVLDSLARDYPDVEQRLLSMGEYGSACAAFEGGIRRDTVHHFHDPDLDSSVEDASKRDLGDGGWGWARKDAAGSVVEVVASTVALRAFALLPAPTARPFVIGAHTPARVPV